MDIYLTDAQQKDLIYTLMFGSYSLKDHSQITLTDYSPNFGHIAGRRSIAINYSVDFKDGQVRYLLLISHREPETGAGLQAITLLRLDEDSPDGTVQALSGLIEAVRQLQEYKVW